MTQRNSPNATGLEISARNLPAGSQRRASEMVGSSFLGRDVAMAAGPRLWMQTPVQISPFGTLPHKKKLIQVRLGQGQPNHKMY